MIGYFCNDTLGHCLWLGSSKGHVLKKLLKITDVERILRLERTQSVMAQKPHSKTFSTFFQDLNGCLTDFSHNDPQSPWAVGGRMAGFYIKKVNKWLTETPFFKNFSLYAPVFLSRFHEFLYRVDLHIDWMTTGRICNDTLGRCLWLGGTNDFFGLNS